MVAQIRVLIADDEEIILSALADYLNDDARLAVVATAADPGTAASLAEQHHPDVALLDVRMPDGGGVRAARAIRARAPDTRVLALSAHGDRDAVLEMLGSGAIGYVVKGSNPQAILEAVLNAAHGLSTLSPEVAGRVVEAIATQMRGELDIRVARESELRRIETALTGVETRIAYQPIWHLRERSIVGREALTRFLGESAPSPDLWFAAAEDCGKSSELEMMSVRCAVEDSNGSPEGGLLWLNLSPGALMSEDFDASLLEPVTDRVVIEITEHAPVANYDQLNAVLRPLRSDGIRVAVDDAGSGYASFRHILNLAPDFIKLDLSLTHGIDHDPRRQALAAALIAFAEAGGATVVGEGIETLGELKSLTELNVTLGQGYLLGRPEVARWSGATPPHWPG